MTSLKGGFRPHAGDLEHTILDSPSDSSRGIEITDFGWKIETCKKPIVNAKEIEACVAPFRFRSWFPPLRPVFLKLASFEQLETQRRRRALHTSPRDHVRKQSPLDVPSADRVEVYVQRLGRVEIG